jgi:hypothetical protein
MQSQDKIPATKGWANLECMFAYADLEPSSISSVINIFTVEGFNLESQRPFVIFGEDPTQPLPIDNISSIPDLIKLLTERYCRRVIVNLRGAMSDVDVRMGITYDFMNRVLILSVREDMIWNYSNNPDTARFERLECFGTYCKRVSQLVVPQFAYIGTELFHPDEVRVDRAQGHGLEPFNDSILSSVRLRELFDWYVKSYARGGDPEGEQSS